MRYISLNNLEEGMIVGRNIMSDTGTSKMPLVMKGTTLSNFIIEALKNKGVKGVYVEDELSQGIEVGEPIISNRVKSLTMQAIKNKDIETIIEQVKDMASNVYHADVFEVDLFGIIEKRNLEGHSMNVCELALALGKEKQLNENQLKEVATVALLHDIGKFLTNDEKKQVEIIVNDDIVKKVENLNMTLDEYLHPIYSYRFLNKFGGILPSVVKHSVLLHHENIDGSGYPLGVTGDKIFLYAKIVSICNLYEHYLNEYSNPQIARERLQIDYANGKIDPELASLFIRKIPIYPVASTVKLSNGSYAVVCNNNKDYPERPTIRLEDGRTIDLTEFSSSNVVVEELCCGNIEEAKKY